MKPIMRRLLAGSRPSWLLAGNPSLQLDWNTGNAWLSNRQYRGETAFKSLFSTFSTPAGYATDSAGVLKLMPANSVHGFYGSDRGQLIEEARTNLLTYSNDFTNASWGNGSRFTITAGQTGAPDGGSNFTKVVPTTASDSKELYHNTAITAAAHTSTLYVKAAGYNFIRGRIYGGAGYVADIIFDISAGTVSSSPSGTGSIASLGGGIYRLVVVGTATGGTGSSSWSICTSSAGTISYAGDGTSGVLFYGAQMELGSFPTSYIPTTSASVARAASSIIANDGTPLATAAQSAKAMFFQTYGIAGISANRFIHFGTGLAAVFSNSTTHIGIYNGSVLNNTLTATYGAGTSAADTKAAFGVDASGMTAVVSGGTKTVTASVWGGNTGDVYFGNRSSGNALNGYLTRSAFSSVKGAFDGLTA